MAIVLRGDGESTFSDDVGIDGTITDSLTVANGLTLTDGNLVVADGHGIDFSATANGTGTVDSELLDDYEQGTWTPVPRDNFSGGNAGSFDNAAQGWYVKVGSQVTAWCRAVACDRSDLNTTFDICIAGLPFTASDDVGNWNGTLSTANVTFEGNIAVRLDANRSAVRFLETISNSGTDFIRVTDVTNNTGNFFFTITYNTDT